MFKEKTSIRIKTNASDLTIEICFMQQHENK